MVPLFSRCFSRVSRHQSSCFSPLGLFLSFLFLEVVWSLSLAARVCRLGCTTGCCVDRILRLVYLDHVSTGSSSTTDVEIQSRPYYLRRQRCQSTPHDKSFCLSLLPLVPYLPIFSSSNTVERKLERAASERRWEPSKLANGLRTLKGSLTGRTKDGLEETTDGVSSPRESTGPSRPRDASGASISG